MDSILEDSVDENSLDNNLVDTISEMFTDEHALDYSSPPLWDDYDDELFDLETVNDDTYDDPFDFKEMSWIFEASRARGFVLRSQELHILSFIWESDIQILSTKPGHLAARLGCAETKVATWDDLAFNLIILGWNVKHRILQNVDPWKRISEKRTKNQAKTDKTEHGMEEREKTKSKSKPKTKKSKSTPTKSTVKVEAEIEEIPYVKALFFIQQAVDDLIFPRIAAATTSTEEWETLKQEYMGDKKVIAVKMQFLRRNFETLGMQKNEKVQEYLSRVSGIMNHMKSFSESLSNETIVCKVLRSLPPKFDHVVAVIEESNDLSAYTFDELMGSLLAHEDRLSRSHENVDEKVLQVKGDSSHNGKTESSGGQEYNRNSNCGRGRGSGTAGDQRDFKSSFKCLHCNKYGHRDVDCWNKPKDEQKHVKFAEKSQEESYLFMVQYTKQDVLNDVWYLGSGCSNHMSHIKSIFKDMDESQKSEVTLGNDKLIKIEGRVTVAIKTSLGHTKLVHDVQYV
ncbi:hypothetical protein Tco_1499206 [Tanacetum coccineum]